MLVCILHCGHSTYSLSSLLNYWQLVYISHPAALSIVYAIDILVCCDIYKMLLFLRLHRNHHCSLRKVVLELFTFFTIYNWTYSWKCFNHQRLWGNFKKIVILNIHLNYMYTEKKKKIPNKVQFTNKFFLKIIYKILKQTEKYNGNK